MFKKLVYSNQIYLYSFSTISQSFFFFYKNNFEISKKNKYDIIPQNKSRDMALHLVLQETSYEMNK